MLMTSEGKRDNYFFSRIIKLENIVRTELLIRILYQRCLIVVIEIIGERLID